MLLGIAFVVLTGVGQENKASQASRPEATYREYWMMLTQPNGEMQTSYRRMELTKGKDQVIRYEHFGRSVVMERSGPNLRFWFPATKELLVAPKTFDAEVSRMPKQAWFDAEAKFEQNVRGPIIVEHTAFADGATLQVDYVLPQLGTSVLVQRASWKRPDGSGGWFQNVASGAASELAPFEIPRSAKAKRATTGEIVARLRYFWPIIFPPGPKPGRG